jgi:hypothetical protein
VVTLAVYLEGGDRKAIDTEDVAVRANKLAPGRFVWRKHPDQINLELIRVYLSDAKKPEKGGWLDGSGKTGWTLTAKGLRWASAAAKTMLDSDLARAREQGGGGSIDEQRWRRERKRLLASEAWRLWVEGETDIPLRLAAEVYRIDSYAVGRIKHLKLARLRDLFAEDPEIAAFLNKMSEILEAIEH